MAQCLSRKSSKAPKELPIKPCSDCFVISNSDDPFFLGCYRCRKKLDRPEMIGWAGYDKCVKNFRKLLRQMRGPDVKLGHANVQKCNPAPIKAAMPKRNNGTLLNIQKKRAATCIQAICRRSNATRRISILIRRRAAIRLSKFIRRIVVVEKIRCQRAIGLDKLERCAMCHLWIAIEDRYLAAYHLMDVFRRRYQVMILQKAIGQIGALIKRRLTHSMEAECARRIVAARMQLRSIHLKKIGSYMRKKMHERLLSQIIGEWRTMWKCDLCDEAESGEPLLSCCKKKICRQCLWGYMKSETAQDMSKARSEWTPVNAFIKCPYCRSTIADSVYIAVHEQFFSRIEKMRQKMCETAGGPDIKDRVFYFCLDNDCSNMTVVGECGGGAQRCAECCGTKSCPKCGIKTMKDGGCNHIACPCGAHWCWICAEWYCTEGYGFYTHPIYRHIETAHPLIGIFG